MHKLVPSHFVAVAEMNVAFGNRKGDPHNIPWYLVLDQVSNIAGDHEHDEYGELLRAVRDRDVIATRDALCDIMVFALGAFHLMGYDADEDLQEVVSALFSRLCESEEVLRETIDHYTELGLVVHAEGAFPRVCVKSSIEQTDRFGERYPRGKFLKAVGYRQPHLELS